MADESTTQAQAAEQAETAQPSTDERIESISSEAELESAFEEINEQSTENADSEEASTETQADQANETSEQASTEPDEESLPERVRLNSLESKDRAIVLNAVQMVRDGLAGNITEAIAKITGINGSAPKESEESTDDQDAAESEFDAKIAAQEQEIDAIRSALRKAKDDFDQEAELQLLEALQDAKSEIRFLKYTKEQESIRSAEDQQQQAATAFETEYNSFREQANNLYPDGSKPGTPMFEEIRKTVQWFEENNPAIFQSPNYPLAIAGIAATNIAKANGTNGKQASRQQSPISETSTGRAPARPTNVLVGDEATSTATAQQNILSAIDKITSEEDLESLAEAVFSGR